MGLASVVEGKGLADGRPDGSLRRELEGALGE